MWMESHPPRDISRSQSMQDLQDKVRSLLFTCHVELTPFPLYTIPVHSNPFHTISLHFAPPHSVPLLSNLLNHSTLLIVLPFHSIQLHSNQCCFSKLHSISCYYILLDSTQINAISLITPFHSNSFFFTPLHFTLLHCIQGADWRSD